MKRQIRTGTFETNSSSSHSLTMLDEHWTQDMIPKLDKITVTAAGEYGWEWEIHSDWNTKLDYLAVDNTDQWQRAVDLIWNRFHIAVEREKNDGYIDHQSAGLTHELSGLSDDELIAWIFNPKNSVDTGNDNE